MFKSWKPCLTHQTCPSKCSEWFLLKFLDFYNGFIFLTWFSCDRPSSYCSGLCAGEQVSYPFLGCRHEISASWFLKHLTVRERDFRFSMYFLAGIPKCACRAFNYVGLYKVCKLWCNWPEPVVPTWLNRDPNCRHQVCFWPMNHVEASGFSLHSGEVDNNSLPSI